MSKVDPDERTAIELLNRQIAGRLRLTVNANFQGRGALAQAAKALGIGPVRLSNYMNGDRTLSPYIISLICVRLGVTADWLIMGKRK